MRKGEGGRVINHYKKSDRGATHLNLFTYKLFYLLDVLAGLDDGDRGEGCAVDVSTACVGVQMRR